MSKIIANKLKKLPNAPGVYFFKDKSGGIIYIGKAAVLKNRVRQYFQSSHSRDPKTEALVGEIADIEWQEVESELDALFLEAELVRRYLPRYNILLRDDKSFVYIRIDYDSGHPTVTTTRRPLDDGARYFGPYLSTLAVRQALKLLRRVFPFATGRAGGQKRASLHYHLGLDPGLEEGKTTLREYRANLRRLMSVIEGKRSNIEKELQSDLKQFAKNLQFEEAAKCRNQLFALKKLSQQVVFGNTEFIDISKDQALRELAELLGLYEDNEALQHPPVDRAQGSQEKRESRTNGTVSEVSTQLTQRSAASSAGMAGFASQQGRTLRLLKRIEGYDISHMSGTDVVASMVVFTNGTSNKSEYRKFKVSERNDDFANMHQTIARRFHLQTPHFQGATLEMGEILYSRRNVSGGWKTRVPDLVLIDGGKGQLDAASRARDEAGLSILMIGLAKREEQIVIRKANTIVNSSQLFVVSQGTGSGVSLNVDVMRKLGGYVSESKDYILVNLPQNSNIVKLLQRIRDESHRFAVSYHSTLKAKRQTKSILDDIPGIGSATRKKLIKHFGSTRAIQQTRQMELERLIGVKKATVLRQYL